jgi:hypothetical protein
VAKKNTAEQKQEWKLIEFNLLGYRIKISIFCFARRRRDKMARKISGIDNRASF